MQKITPFLWFDTQAEEAMNYYVSVFKNSKAGAVTRYPDPMVGPAADLAGKVMTVSFELEGQQFTGLNAGPIFKFNEAVSFVVACDDQTELDYYWSKLSAHPENEQCGWCKDQFGLSWQIVPHNMGELVAPADPEKAKRAMAAMMQMKKIDIAALENA